MVPTARIDFTAIIKFEDDSIGHYVETIYGGYEAEDYAGELGIIVSQSTILRARKERIYHIEKTNRRAYLMMPRSSKNIASITIKIQRIK
jgi:hypothetical protein